MTRRQASCDDMARTFFEKIQFNQRLVRKHSRQINVVVKLASVNGENEMETGIRGGITDTHSLPAQSLLLHKESWPGEVPQGERL